MSGIPLAVDIVTVCGLVACLHYHYGNWRKQHLLVTLTTFVAWFFPFMIIFVMPIDVSNTSYNQCVKDHENVTTPAVYTLPSTIDDNTISTHLPTSSSSLFTTTISSTSITSSHLLTNASATTTHSSNYDDGNHDDSCSKPLSYVDDPVLSILWHVVYWTSQSLTWIILPMMQSYAKAGEFTVLGKLKYALIANAIYYGTYLLIFGACLIYLAVKPQPGFSFNAAQIKVLAITASNTWGLFLLVLLLGYGLMEVPRLCWMNSKRGHMLSRIHFKLAKLSIEKIEAEEELEDTLTEISRLVDSVKDPNPLRKYLEIILKKCPESFHSSSSTESTSRPRAAFDRSNDPGEVVTYRSLARLHRRLIVSVQRQSMTRCQWMKLMDSAMELEDVAENETSPTRVFRSSSGMYDGIWKHCHSPALEWYWKCWFCAWFLRLAAASMFTFSLVVIWSECLFFVQSPVLSIFALLIELAKSHYNYIAIEFVCVLTISYLSICAYYTIFKIRIFNYYYVVGNHQTDENSLIFCGMLLCRLTPPLCLNFLGLIHLDSHITKAKGIVDTAYTQFMGHMDVISFISDGFNIYFPIAIVVLCILTFFKVGTRLLHLLGFQQFIGDDDMTQELIDEGKELVKRERRKRSRVEDTETRRRTWNDRFNDQNSTTATATPFDPDESSRRRNVRNPRENDRSELLREAEAIDYQSSEIPRPTNAPNIPGLYQMDPSFKPQMMTADQGFGSTTVRPTRQPPRNIFDDV